MSHYIKQEKINPSKVKRAPKKIGKFVKPVHSFDFSYAIKKWDKKKKHIENLASNIRSLRYNVSRDLKSDDQKQMLTALVIAVMDKTAERVGNDDSAQSGHFGVTGFKKKHVTVIGSTVHLKYMGKSGVDHEKSFSDKQIAKALKQAIKNSPSEFVFQTSDGFRIRADKVNRYLKEYDISAKDIRGFCANSYIISRLKKMPVQDVEKKRKSDFNKAAKYTAIKVGHGTGTLKSHYLMPELSREYIKNGKIIDLNNFYKEGGATKLLAPNGKQSNLNAEQYHLVRTPDFKKWFGDWENNPQKASKVVDENGEPLVVYHGTGTDFTVFKIGPTGGIFFTDKKSSAELFSEGYLKRQGLDPHIKECFLNLRKPFDLESTSDEVVEKEYWDEYFAGRWFIKKKTQKQILSEPKRFAQKELVTFGIVNQDAKEKIIQHEYDGIVFEAKNRAMTYVAFYPEQIKLADGTNKTFDPKNPDIRFDEGGETNEKIKDYQKHGDKKDKNKEASEGAPSGHEQRDDDVRLLGRKLHREVQQLLSITQGDDPLSSSTEEAIDYVVKKYSLDNESANRIRQMVADGKFQQGGETKSIEQKLKTLMEMMQKHERKKNPLFAYTDEISDMLYSGHDFKSKIDHEKIAQKYGIERKDVAKEYAEYAIVKTARRIIADKHNQTGPCFEALRQMYQIQPSLTHRTSLTAIHQQYSTPAPIAYLMGKYAQVDKPGLYFEPTAGTGLLTIAGNQKDWIVNEIDKNRLDILRDQHFKKVISQDATTPFNELSKDMFDAVVTNPPFGNTKHSVQFGKYQVSGLEQQIACRALQYMKDSGRASIIIGGYTEYDDMGRLKSKKDMGFFNYLYHYFNLEDVINVSGEVYRKQGAGYPIRIILINGRKSEPKGVFPLLDKTIPVHNPYSYKIVTDLSDLYKRFSL